MCNQLLPQSQYRKKKAQRVCFVGYSKNSMEYRLMDLSSEKCVTRRDFTVNKVDFRFFNQKIGSSSEVHIDDEKEY